MLIFGRAAMGEDVHRGFCRDAWRVRRDGRLVFADSLQLDGAIAATLDRRLRWVARGQRRWCSMRPRCGGSPRAVACAIGRGAEHGRGQQLERLLVARAYAGDGRTLQGDLAPLLEFLAGRPLPRVWRC